MAGSDVAITVESMFSMNSAAAMMRGMRRDCEIIAGILTTQPERHSCK